jgi:hypothetical protein
VTGVTELKDLQTLLKSEGIDSIQIAMRRKDLAKLGDPLTNLLFSLAYSLHSKNFGGEKVSGKTLAAALRFAELRQLAPSRLDAHGLGDCVEAMIAYGWLQGFFTISDAVKVLQEQFLLFDTSTDQSRRKRSENIARSFSVLLQRIYEQEQLADTTKSQ